MPQDGAYLFLLGLSCGITLCAATAYRRITPSWLRLLLMACSLFVASRYVAMALFTSPDAPSSVWVGLAVPSIFAVDQVLRHPAMTPTKLLRWCAPLVAAYAAVLGAATVSPVPDAFGWAPQLSQPWRTLLPVIQLLFVAGFVAVNGLFIMKVPVKPVRIALLVLATAQVFLLFGGLAAEMFAVLAVWYAFDTGTRLQQNI